MKKIILFTCFILFAILFACVEKQYTYEQSKDNQSISAKDNENQFISLKNDNKVKYNEDCMDMHIFKVFQVLNDGYALAHACNDKNSCFGPVVLLKPRYDMQYYDEMLISLPKNKCAIQDGVYKYTTKNNTDKTVPRIYFGFKASPKSPDEAIEMSNDYFENIRYRCKLLVDINKAFNTKTNMNKCDCISDLFKEEFTIFFTDTNKYENYTMLEKAVKTKSKKKCGNIPQWMGEFFF